MTVSPGDTETAVTVPDTGNRAVTWVGRLTVPVKGSDCAMAPVVTTVVR